MKKKVLLSSILTIALCLSLIAGSTYALFTDSAEFNIAVTAGKVDIEASLTVENVWSVEPADNGSIVDEYDATYEYSYSHADTFINGGTATVTGAEVTLDNITPGDKVDLLVSGTNGSDVDVQYRYVIECTEGLELMHGLLVYVDGATEGISGMKSYTTAWTKYEAPQTDADKAFSLPITIELPVDAGNEYQDKTAKIKVLVEAVQGNANVTDPAEKIVTFDALASTEADLAAAVAAGENVVLASDIAVTKTLLAKKDVVIDLNGHTIDAANSSSNYLFQSQSNAAPSMIITSSQSGAVINAGNKAVLLGYGSTEISNVEINVGTASSAVGNPFNVYGDLTLGEGTVVNVEYLGTSLINNNGAIAIVIDGAQINVDEFKVNGGAIISINQATTVELNNTEVNVGLTITTFGSYFISQENKATINGCTFNVVGSDGVDYTVSATGKQWVAIN